MMFFKKSLYLSISAYVFCIFVAKLRSPGSRRPEEFNFQTDFAFDRDGALSTEAHKNQDW